MDYGGQVLGADWWRSRSETGGLSNRFSVRSPDRRKKPGGSEAPGKEKKRMADGCRENDRVI